MFEFITFENFFVAVAVISAAYPIIYGIGWVCSRGWHRGKREFVDRMVKDCSSKES